MTRGYVASSVLLRLRIAIRWKRGKSKGKQVNIKRHGHPLDALPLSKNQPEGGGRGRLGRMVTIGASALSWGGALGDEGQQKGGRSDCCERAMVLHGRIPLLGACHYGLSTDSQ